MLDRILRLEKRVNDLLCTIKHLTENGGGGNGGGVTVHNNLNNIQGGQNGQYYHLTQEEHRRLTDGSLTQDHNKLENVQGGKAGERYHLTADERQKLINGVFINDHDDLQNIQGGSPGQHIHLTNQEYRKLVDGTFITKHSQLSEMQGGKNGEYYHLTADEYQKITDLDTLTKEFVVSKGAGSMTPGKVFPAGLTLAEAFMLLLTETYNPTFTNPTFNLTSNGTNREVGEKFNLTLNVAFDQGKILGKNENGVWNANAVQDGRAGFPISYVINGTTYEATLLNQTITIRDFVATSGRSTFTASVNYGVGSQPFNSENEPFEQPYPAGSMNSSTWFEGKFRRYSGSVSTMPENGQQIRTMLTNSSVLNTSNDFTFSTGTTNKIFVIAVPNGKSVTSIVNTITTENLTNMFILSEITQIPDGGGNMQTYKVYIMEIAVPFSQDYPINVKIN